MGTFQCTPAGAAQGVRLSVFMQVSLCTCASKQGPVVPRLSSDSHPHPMEHTVHPSCECATGRIDWCQGVFVSVCRLTAG